MTKEPIIGIDLGTTNSCAAIDERGTELIGHEAKRQWQLNPKNTVYGAKRLVGRPYNSDVVATMKKVVAYNMRPGQHNDVVIDVGKKELTLQQLSARILNRI